MSKIRFRTSLSLVAALSVVAGMLAAAPASAATRVADGSASDAANGGSSFVSFDAFLSGLSGATFDAYASARATGAVRSAQTFNQMRSYALDLYRGVKVTHSYLDSGSYFDCVVTETQPSVRALGLKKLAAAPQPTAEQAAPANPTSALAADVKPAGQLAAGQKDAFGNTEACAAGTIPMQRVSMGRLMKFASLKEFLAKRPAKFGKADTAELGASTPLPDANAPHRYAVGYQYVANHGGNAILNTWNPYGEFSLSQEWYVNGGQTVEGGWVHYVPSWGNNPALFIFFTPDNYATGCYNLTCTGFVQVSSAYALGGAWASSGYGGPSYGFSLQWKYYAGNWWLYIQGTALGYYPGSVYNGGPMGSGNSNLAEWGGETWTSGTYWPQMGSGNWPSAGAYYAAFQNTVFYIGSNDVSYWPSLTPYRSNPACYDISLASTYFYFGGPGGYC